MEGTIATIMMFAGNFAPRNWAFCDGSLIAIASNTALFSLLGNTYGGNGTTNFGLPDLRGRVAIGAGQGRGLSPYSLGQTHDAEQVSITTGQMAMHTHTPGAISIPVSTNTATAKEANNNILATPSADTYATLGTTPTVNYGGFSVADQPVGSGIPISIMQPYLAVNYVVCMYGVFPSRP